MMLHKIGIFSFGKRGERGTSLIETITGLGIFMMIGVVFISGLATNYKGQMVREKVATGTAPTSIGKSTTTASAASYILPEQIPVTWR